MAQEKKDLISSYMQDRYLDRLIWYDKVAIRNQKTFKVLQWSLIILSSLTPVLIAFELYVHENTGFIWIPICTSVLVAVISSAQKTFNFQENWIRYRNTWELLQKELYLYQGNIDIYRNAKRKDALFIERVESIISQEATSWSLLHLEKSEK